MTTHVRTAAPAVEKALDILELLAEVPNGLTMNEMTEALGRTMGEIYRIVLYLAERDYLEQNPETNRYALTLRLFELSHRHDPTERLIQAAIPCLERYAEASLQSCHLGVLNRANVLALTSVQSPLPAGYSVRTGALFPAEQTSTGHVILAFSSAEIQLQYIEGRENEDELRNRFAEIRRNGYEDTESTMFHGVRNLCVPVFDSRGIVGALTSGFMQQPANLDAGENALWLLRETAASLSSSLGFDLDRSPYKPALTSWKGSANG